MLYYTQAVWRSCLSEEEQEKVKRFIFRAWGIYKPAEEVIYNFMQEIMLNIKHWVGIVQEISADVTPNVSFSSYVRLDGDQVDVAVSTGTYKLLMNVLPDEDYEVAGSINDECHGSIMLVRDGVISLGFVSMLRRIQKTLCRLEPNCTVDIGIVTSRKTLQNVAKALEQVNLTHGLKLFDYDGLKDSLKNIMRREEECIMRNEDSRQLPCGPVSSDVD